MVRNHVALTINGRLHEFRGAEAYQPLSDTLRYCLRKTGTKVVCAEGDCGACTVLFARAVGLGETLKFRSLNSCIRATFSLDGCHVITVEGLESETGLSEIQESMVRNFSSQCGFCTPGFVMSLAALFENKKTVTDRVAKNHLTGNLCRCTGYTAILQAAKDVDPGKVSTFGDRPEFFELTGRLLEATREPARITADQKEVYLPHTLDQALAYKKEYPEARLVSGGTDIGVQINKGKNPGERLLSLNGLRELEELEASDDRISVGARVTLNDLQEFLSNRVPAFSEFLNIFASPQIKNVATLVGNIGNGSPIADTAPFLFAVEAKIHVLGPEGSREISIDEFYKGYRELDLRDGEFITSVSFPIPPSKMLGLYKVSQRRDLDISCVNSCFLVEKEYGKIQKARIVYGGVGPVPLRLKTAESLLEGKEISRGLIDQVKSEIEHSLNPLSDVRGSREFRKKISVNLFEKYAREFLNL